MIEDIHIIPLGMVKSFLLTCEGKLVLIDTGYTNQDAQTILETVEKMKRAHRDLGLCIITHYHGDHVGGLMRLKEACAFKVASHEGDAERIFKDTGVRVDMRLKDGEVLPYCGGIRVVHVPGHTTGNMVLYLEKKRAIIVGDTIFADEKGNLAPPPAQYCEDVAMARRELKRLLKLDFDAVLVSHGADVYSGGKEKVKVLVA